MALTDAIRRGRLGGMSRTDELPPAPPGRVWLTVAVLVPERDCGWGDLPPDEQTDILELVEAAAKDAYGRSRREDAVETPERSAAIVAGNLDRMGVTLGGERHD